MTEPLDFFQAQKEIESKPPVNEMLRYLESGSNEPPPPIPTTPDSTEEIEAAQPVEGGEEVKPEDVDSLGIFGQGVDFLTWVASPLMAFGEAGMAPIAHEYESETYLGKVAESFEVSGKALMDAMFPEYGERRPYYGYQIVDKYAPHMNPTAKQLLAPAIEVVTDPLTSLTIAPVKAFQLGAREATMAKGLSNGMGIWENGIRRMFGMDVPQVQKLSPTSEYLTALRNTADPETRKILNLAAKADTGDAKATKAMIEELGLEAGSRAAKAANEQDMIEALANIEKVTGNAVDELFSAPLEVVDRAKWTNAVDNTTVVYTDFDINLGKVNSAADVDLAVGEIATRAGQNLDPAEQMTKLSDMVNGRPVAPMEGGTAFALRQMMLSNGAKIRSLAKAASNKFTRGPAVDYALQKRLFIQKILNERAVGQAPNASESALKALTVHSQTPVGRYREYQRMHSLIAESHDYRHQLNALLKATDNPYEVNRIVEAAFRSNVIDRVYEVWLNGILSGPVTHAVNIASNAMNLFYVPGEAFLSGVSAVVRGEMRQGMSQINEARVMMATLGNSVRDSVRLMKKHGIDQVDMPEELARLSEVFRTRHLPKISAEAMGKEGQLGKFYDYIGNMIRLPGEYLMREDMAFKLLHYRMQVAREAAIKAQSAADPKVADALFNFHTRHPAESISSHAMDVASYYTFTNELGDAGKRLQSFSRIPGMRWLLPFVQTPTNIVKFGIKHSFFGTVHKDLGFNIMKRTPAGDAARAKVAMGTLIPMALLAHLDDNITGSVDVESPEGRFLQSKGHPPYSIRIGENWYSYERIEPLRTVLGLLVSYRDAWRHLDLSEEADVELGNELMSTLVTPFIKVVTGNYLFPQLEALFYGMQGIAYGKFDYSAGQAERLLSNMIPFSNFMVQTNRAFFDPAFRDADGILQEIKKRIPGLSRSVPAYLDLWGDEQFMPPGLGPDIVSPIPVRAESQDAVDREIIRLEMAVPDDMRLPERKKQIRGIELNNTQRYHFARMVGKGFEGVPPLKEQLRELMEGDVYNKLGDQGRANIIRLMVNQRRDAVENFMLTTDDELQQQYIRNIRIRAEMMRPVE